MNTFFLVSIWFSWKSIHITTKALHYRNKFHFRFFYKILVGIHLEEPVKYGDKNSVLLENYHLQISTLKELELFTVHIHLE